MTVQSKTYRSQVRSQKSKVEMVTQRSEVVEEKSSNKKEDSDRYESVRPFSVQDFFLQRTKDFGLETSAKDSGHWTPPSSESVRNPKGPNAESTRHETPNHGLPMVRKVASTRTEWKLDAVLRTKIVQVVGAIESKNNYGAINKTPAGGGIAYGMLQVLSRTGGLHQMLQQYAAAGGSFAQELSAFGHSTSPRVAGNKRFRALLQKAGDDPVMQQVQRRFFSNTYLQPAVTFGKYNQLRLPASYLILFDAFIHYGADKKWLQQKISKLVKKHGEEKGMKTFLKWMKGSLYASYSRRYGARSVEARYNVWRADFLYSVLRTNPQLQGTITLRAPQWSQPVHIK